MNRERLIHLAELLKDVPADAFDITNFVGTVDGEGNSKWLIFMTARSNKFHKEYERCENENLPLVPILHKCGCTACACGYAGLDPWFREQGFKTLSNGEVMWTNPETGDTSKDYNAMEFFFDLDEAQTDYLFISRCYTAEQRKDPRFVSRRIMDFLKEDGVVPEEFLLFSARMGIDEDREDEDVDIDEDDEQ